jgi:hypothetical protein
MSFVRSPYFLSVDTIQQDKSLIILFDSVIIIAFSRIRNFTKDNTEFLKIQLNYASNTVYGRHLKKECRSVS